MKITIAQLKSGDLERNLAKLKELNLQTDLIVLPETFLYGHPEDLLLTKVWFRENIRNLLAIMRQLQVDFPDIGWVVGGSWAKFADAFFISEEEQLVKLHGKKRVDFRGEKIGFLLNDDLWDRSKVAEHQEAGATLIISLNTLPFYQGIEKELYNQVRKHVGRYRLPFLLVNQVGKINDFLFEGKCFCLDSVGEPLVILPSFEESVQTFSLSQQERVTYLAVNEKEAVRRALVAGIREFFQEAGFCRALIGLSGGIDSAVAAALAVEALGPENVLAVTLPSPFTPQESVEDAKKLANNLGVCLRILEIKELYETYLELLKADFEGLEFDQTEENLQARIRGTILMALANKFNCLLLNASNKSELATGYCTLYGDLCGALGVLRDVPKTLVYELAAELNREKEIIPQEIIKKEPSAELRPGQKDGDSLPPYEVLDEILEYLVGGCVVSDLVEKGFEKELVEKIRELLIKNEHKRRQAPPGLIVTTRPETLLYKF